MTCNAFWGQNGRPTYQRAITKAFHEYIDVLRNFFINDFTIFNDLSIHLEKLKFFFLK
jgi:hypothetical protein